MWHSNKLLFPVNGSKYHLIQFLLIFRKASLGELEIDGLKRLAELSEIDVSQEGVGGAKSFFEAKVCSAISSICV